MNTYECMYILQASLSDDEADRANQRIAEEIEKRGGSILHRDRLGKKRLAYPIRKHDDGAYYLMYFELPPGEIAALRSAYRLHPRLLRLLILRKEREEVAKLQRRTREPEHVAAGESDTDAATKTDADKASGDESSDDETDDEPEADATTEDAAPGPEPDTQE